MANTKAVRILVADDHSVVRRGVRALLESDPRWKVCAEGVSGRDAVAKAKELKPDIVLLDISMPDLNGLDATRQILKVVPQTKVVIFTMYGSEQVVREVLSAGARGYVLKSDADRDLLAALEAMDRDQPFFTSKVSQMVLEGYLHRRAEPDEEQSRGRLTPRQQEIVRLLAEGQSNKEVATTLGISVKTVEAHRSNIMRKLALHAFSDLVRYAVRQKIVGP